MCVLHGIMFSVIGNTWYKVRPLHHSGSLSPPFPLPFPSFPFLFPLLQLFLPLVVSPSYHYIASFPFTGSAFNSVYVNVFSLFFSFFNHFVFSRHVIFLFLKFILRFLSFLSFSCFFPQFLLFPPLLALHFL